MHALVCTTHAREQCIRGSSLLFFITLEPRVERYNSLCALNTSPPRGLSQSDALVDHVFEVGSWQYTQW